MPLQKKESRVVTFQMYAFNHLGSYDILMKPLNTLTYKLEFVSQILLFHFQISIVLALP